jgi:hypothetical protein
MRGRKSVARRTASSRAMLDVRWIGKDRARVAIIAEVAAHEPLGHRATRLKVRTRRPPVGRLIPESDSALSPGVC